MDKQPQIIWDQGSAYDLFVSLWIIHRPDEFGLRPSWAAGVRSRLPVPLRDILEQSQTFLKVPMRWIHTLPAPKDAQSALQALNEIPAKERLSALAFTGKEDEESRAFHQFLLSLDGKQRLSTRIEQHIQDHYQKSGRATKPFIRAMFDAWSNRDAFGEALTQALDAYVENFFKEEEIRIVPVQELAMKNFQIRLEKEDLLALLEEVSSGVRMDWVPEVENLILAPSFWGSPFVFYDSQDKETGIILFGARPKGLALVPGELIPEDLINPLKALADPTRLRILRYLQETPRTPSELARILRLRPPTVIHHLNNLRLAGLVLVTVSPEAERRYAIRKEGLEDTIASIQKFLAGE